MSLPATEDLGLATSLDSEWLTLRYNTPKQWAQTVLADFNRFLNDHAQAEKKASGMALSMLSHYPDKPELVRAMVDLSIEEMCHFREVIKLMQARELSLTPDEKDPYVNQIRKTMRDGREVYMMDRLLTAAIIEARGCERFTLIGEALEDEKLKSFYQAIAASESKHHLLFIQLAELYFPVPDIQQRLDELLDIEARITESLPFRAALH